MVPPSVNKGSKAMMMGLGREPVRALLQEFDGDLPQGVSQPVVFLPGTLVVQGPSFAEERDLPQRLAESPALAEWPVVVLVDDSRKATAGLKQFLWSLFTRFEPAADIHGAQTTVQRFHVGLTPPIVFDCRMKPWYPHILEVDAETKQKVDSRISRLIPAQWR